MLSISAKINELGQFLLGRCYNVFDLLEQQANNNLKSHWA